MGARHEFRSQGTDEDAVFIRHKPGTSKHHALTVHSDNDGAPAILVRGNGTLIDLRDLNNVTKYSISSSGSLSINATGNKTSYPLGPSDALHTGLNILSSFEGGEDEGEAGQFDSTGRVNLYSYQRADVGSYGENVRRFLMRENAKSMDAWYMPRENGQMTHGYDGNGNPDSDARWVPVAWTGAHWKSNDGLSIHGHWSVEVPDSTGAVQTRFEVPFTDQEAADGSKLLGVDVTNIMTNLADLTVRATNGQVLRVGASNAHNKDILLSISSNRATSGRRWAIRANTTTEAGSNAGTDFQLVAYSDAGAELAARLHITRSTGRMSVGGTSTTAAQVTASWSGSGIHGFLASASAAIGNGAAYAAILSASTERLMDFRVTGDTLARVVLLGTSVFEFGDGSATRDVSFGRASTAQLRVTPTANASNSTSVGGALNITNTSSTGAGLVVYSTQSAPSGHLVVARANHATFNQNAIYSEYIGTGHAVSINHQGTGSASSALNVASTNTDHSAVGISGVETGKGTLKVTHTGTGTDGNASALSIDLAGSGTAAQGIFMDATGGGTTGRLLEIRNNGTTRLRVDSSGNMTINGNIGFYNTSPVAKQTVTGDDGDNAALQSLLTALANLGLITNSAT